MSFKIGMGYDIHRFAQGRKLVLGGIEIPHERGLEGHSDADVLLHALCDAILGALGLGDIGEHFPNTDMKFKDISSLKLLDEVKAQMELRQFRIGNIDCMVQAEEPKINAHKAAMQSKIAEHLAIDQSLINIKATTMEKLGSIGRAEGIAAFATVLLERV